MLKRLIIPLQDCMSPNFTSINSTKKEDNEDEDPDFDVEDPMLEDNEDEDPDFDVEDPMLDQEEKEKQKKTKGKGAKRGPKVAVFIKKTEPMTEYELMIQKNREEKMAFLQSLKINEAKADLFECIESTKNILRELKRKRVRRVEPFKKQYKSVESTSPPPLRKSRRLENHSIDSSRKDYFTDACHTLENVEKSKFVSPPNITFKEALESDDIYESYKVDISFSESAPEAEFVYEKSVLGEMTVSESNRAHINPYKTTALEWYPSSERMIVAAGDKYGYLGIWKTDTDSPYVFNIHRDKITHLQFNPYNQIELISSSSDGTLCCGNMMQHNFELHCVTGKSCSYFDILSATSCLTAYNTGHVYLTDKRTRDKSCVQKYKCHNSFISTVHIHPTNRNYFLTAVYNGSVALWDLRKIESAPVADLKHQNSFVNSAFFSPVTGNSILATSCDDSIRIFDSTNLTSDIKVRVQMNHINHIGNLYTHKFRAKWLPNSEEAFVVGSELLPPRIEVYDKNMFACKPMMHENFTDISSVYAFHPTKPTLAAADIFGNVFVFE